jgi:hypothetical protein
MATPNHPVHVFFSWQSDSPKQSNSGAIRAALKSAAKAITDKHPALTIILDEATRGESGSPNIADKIVEKIDKAHIYIADITTVTASGAPRPSANPNVLIELGYAVAQVGWDRIVLLFNTVIGNFPADLPFDIIQNRVATYALDPANVQANQAEKLHKLMEAAIQAVLDKNPKTPVELRGLEPEKIRHERDIENLNWMLSQIHIPTLEEHISNLPRFTRDPIFWFWESFKGVVTSSLFHLYDSTLDAQVVRLYQAWDKTLSFGERYQPSANGEVYVFSNPGDVALDEDQENDWKEIQKGAAEIAAALQDLLTRVRSRYVEVDIKQTNNKAWSDYVDFHKSLTL